MLADARNRPNPSIAAPFRDMRLALDTVDILKSQVNELFDNGCEIYTTWGPPGTGKTTWSSEKFIELAEKRTINALKAIRVLSKLGNRNAYDYNDADVKKIVKALIDEIEALKVRMNNTKGSDGIDFKL